MKFSVVTLFPEMFSGVFEYSIVNRAIKGKKVEIEFINLRDFGEGRHKVVDDKPYGGGAGMILRVDVLKKAIDYARTQKGNEKVVLLDARGQRYSQEKAEELSKVGHIILVCGRYEGFDERIREFIDYTISIGDYILTGGEIPAMAIVDSITRLIPNVLAKETATKLESFSKLNSRRILEYPQYTRPDNFEGLKVPKVLLSGNEAKINEFREKEAMKLTKKHRPDLL